MSMVKTLLCKIGHLLLSIVRALRKVICCRRKKETEYLLPLTVKDIELKMKADLEIQAQWDAWPETDNLPPNNGTIQTISESDARATYTDEASQEDFFKDMVPQIRKPKKIYIKNDKDAEHEKISANRLAMDPKAILVESDLGVIDDNLSTWEDSESLQDVWEPDLLMRETKQAQQEKRRAEHQRRKQEKENRRSSKPDSLSMMLNISDSKDKHKYS